MRNILLSITVSLCTLLGGCGAKVPGTARTTDEIPAITPDYTGVTVPPNIAPLRFMLDTEAEEAVAVLSANGVEMVEKAEDGKFLFGERQWRKLMEAAREDSVSVRIYVRNSDEWTTYRPFGIHVAAEPVDDWLAYRLIPPGYELWHEMGIFQRNLTSFDERTVVNNKRTSFNCMNCHSFRSQSPDDMLFHMRSDHGGTYLWTKGRLEKLDGNVSDNIRSLVYPYWHPSGDYIAFSTNTTKQMFHMTDRNRIEVFDASSDVLVYDVRNRRALTDSLLFSKDAFETFPTFSPDGKTLYFCSAVAREMPKEYRNVRYNLCSIAFDPQKGRFGDRVDTLYHADKAGRTAVFPRVSPDGHFLAFTEAAYGNFTIWHKEADLRLIDLRTGGMESLDELNSSEAESYHSWSSNGRWLVFASRRMDGLYTRPFIAYIDASGKASKPFAVPQRTPDFYHTSLKSYNVPEFIQSPVTLGSAEIVRTAREGQSLKISLEK